MHERLSLKARESILREVPEIEAALERILAVLNQNAKECPCCKMFVREVYREHQMADTIRGARTKLRRLEEEAGGRNRSVPFKRPVGEEPSSRPGG